MTPEDEDIAKRHRAVWPIGDLLDEVESLRQQLAARDEQIRALRTEHAQDIKAYNDKSFELRDAEQQLQSTQERLAEADAALRWIDKYEEYEDPQDYPRRVVKEYFAAHEPEGKP